MDKGDTAAARILRAAHFAARVHATHKRKGASAEPYVNHVLEVARILAENGAPEEAILAGLLHDTVEDSDNDPEPITHGRLVAEFGDEAPMRDRLWVVVAVLDRVVQQPGEDRLLRRAVLGQDTRHFEHMVHIGLGRGALALVRGVHPRREMRRPQDARRGGVTFVHRFSKQRWSRKRGPKGPQDRHSCDHPRWRRAKPAEAAHAARAQTDLLAGRTSAWREAKPAEPARHAEGVPPARRV